MKGQPDLSIAVVSHNTREALRDCLTSLDAHGRSGRAVIEVLVVDAGSDDESAQLVAREFPWVRLFASPQNLGFTRGNNWALRVARGRHLMLLNPDTVVTPGALDRLVDYLDAEPDVGIVGPQLRFPDGSVQSSRRRLPTPLTGFVESTVLERWLSWTPIVRRFRLADRSDHQQQDVEWLVGAALVIRGETARAVGLLDERFFMYSEEVDYCQRVRAAGWRVVYLPEAVVLHAEGKSSEQNLLARNERFFESRFRYYAKYFGGGWAVALRLAVLGHFGFLAIEETIKLGLRPNTRMLRRQRIDTYRQVLGRQTRALVRPTPLGR